MVTSAVMKTKHDGVREWKCSAASAWKVGCLGEEVRDLSEEKTFSL